MDDDERFKHLASDPRFKPLKFKHKKVEVDDRFSSMFTDKRFVLKYTRDKRGRNQNKTTGDDLKRYYYIKDKDKKKKHDDKKDEVEEKDDDDQIEDEEENSDNEEQEVYKEDDDGIEPDNEEEEQEVDEDSDSVFVKEEEQTDPEDFSSSSDESDSEVEASEDELDNIQFEWEPLDKDAEIAKQPTKRIAVQNFDWNQLTANDIYTIVNSVRPPISVSVYISQFGKERLAREEAEGPQEIVDMPKVDEDEEDYNKLKQRMDIMSNPLASPMAPNQYEDADECEDLENEEIRERIRRYELNRLKYYYAVVEFDSVESAQLVYKELDGMEYEGSSIELDLRYIPNDMDFDEDDLKSRCDKLPDLASYKAPQFINSALQQTKVQFSWDQTDCNRQERLHKAYTKEELEKDDLAAYLASNSEDEVDDEETEVEDDKKDDDKSATMNKYQSLLQALDEKNKDEKVDLEIEWEAELSGSDAGISESGSDEQEDEQEQQVAKRNKKKDIKLVEPKKSVKKSKQKGKKRKQMDDDVDTERYAQLELVAMGGNEAKLDDFEFDANDERFTAVYKSKLYNIDPSHPKFKKTKAFEMIAENKRQRRTRE